MPIALTSFKVLSFDIYTTLIDWETGIHDALLSLLYLGSSPPDRSSLLTSLKTHEVAILQEQPALRYDKLLAQAFERLAIDFENERGKMDVEKRAVEFAKSIAYWPAFADTVQAMHKLGKYYKLVVLSNVDNVSFDSTLSGSLKGVNFDAIYTAEDIGSYKPDLRNFEYLVAHVESEFGIGKDGILHTAQALRADHVPAKEMGINSCWIARNEDKNARGGSPRGFEGGSGYRVEVSDFEGDGGGGGEGV
ncbi:MAG: hypothetical protein M1812_001799 [Candelaria pacifica]|nr:MAG: hypothetical protein M1812_001799 [Candelaria pacifica]